jgi:hypothetical protein
VEREEYLGDAVYVSFDGYQIWLRTGDGNNQRIALEPVVYDRLVRYVESLKRHIAQKRTHSSDDVA